MDRGQVDGGGIRDGNVPHADGGLWAIDIRGVPVDCDTGGTRCADGGGIGAATDGHAQRRGDQAGGAVDNDCTLLVRGHRNLLILGRGIVDQKLIDAGRRVLETKEHGRAADFASAAIDRALLLGCSQPVALQALDHPRHRGKEVAQIFGTKRLHGKLALLPPLSPLRREDAMNAQILEDRRQGAGSPIGVGAGAHDLVAQVGIRQRDSGLWPQPEGEDRVILAGPRFQRQVEFFRIDLQGIAEQGQSTRARQVKQDAHRRSSDWG